MYVDPICWKNRKNIIHNALNHKILCIADKIKINDGKFGGTIIQESPVFGYMPFVLCGNDM